VYARTKLPFFYTRNMPGECPGLIYGATAPVVEAPTCGSGILHAHDGVNAAQGEVVAAPSIGFLSQ